jgi:NAD(P)-dependent dehydrogenase (short-subunit alcohol dehydrogenase family)
MRLEKATALVTGASSGIGKAVSSHFRREGARLLLTGRKEQLDTAQPDDLYVPGDLNDEAFVESLAHRAAESLGTVDVVVLNHGLQASSPLTEMAYDDAKDVLHSNLLSAFLVMKHFAPLMPSAGGSFVCVGSRLGMVGKPGEVLYSAAKGGLIMLAKGAAIEWAPRNIRVNVVAPGLTATPVIEASFQRRPDPDAYLLNPPGARIPMPWKSLRSSPWAGSTVRIRRRSRTSMTAKPGVSPTATCAMVTGFGPRRLMYAYRLSGETAMMSGVLPTKSIRSSTSKVCGSMMIALLVTRLTIQSSLWSGVSHTPWASWPPDSPWWTGR